MGKKKQRENEEKYLDPVLQRLKPYWADIFDMMMRGKQRGDGLMLDDGNLEQIEEGISQKVSEAKTQARKEAMENLGYDSSRGWHDVRYADRMTREQKDKLDKEKREEMNLDFDPRKEKQAYAVYMRNEIETSDRGSWVSAKNLFTRMEDIINSDKATVVAGVFGTLREHPSFTPKPPSQASTSSMSRMYGDTEEKAQNRAEMRRSIFKEGELR